MVKCLQVMNCYSWSFIQRLWKRLERLETEKRLLKGKIETNDSPGSSATVPLSFTSSSSGVGSAPGSSPSQSMLSLGISPMTLEANQQTNLTDHLINLRKEVTRLKTNLEKTERDHKRAMSKMAREEKAIRDENLRLQRRLQLELDRREALCRHMSESESSLEMDDERLFNRVRTLSSPAAGLLPKTSQPIGLKVTPSVLTSPGSVGLALSTSNAARGMGPTPMAVDLAVCPACNQKYKI